MNLNFLIINREINKRNLISNVSSSSCRGGCSPKCGHLSAAASRGDGEDEIGRQRLVSAI